MEDPVRHGPFFNPVVGFFYIFFLWLINTFGAVYMCVPFVPLLFICPNVFRFYEDFCFGVGIQFSSFILSAVWGMRFVATGDVIRPERALVVMNHRTNFDWLFYWECMCQYGDISKLKVLLKDELRRLPGFGWIGQFTAFGFLRRKFEADRPLLYRILTLYTAVPNYPYQCLLFPEGTTLQQFSRAKSDAWAKEHNQPCYQHVLHPRTLGFTFAVEHLRSLNGMDAIYDVTMGYPQGPLVSKLGIVLGQPPPEVHIHIHRFPVSDIPTDTKGLEQWCMARWAEKEKLLEAFSSAKRFPGEPLAVHPHYALFRNVSTLFWLLFVPSILYGTVVFAPMRYYFLVVGAVLTVLSHTVGVEAIELTARGIRAPQKTRAE